MIAWLKTQMTVVKAVGFILLVVLPLGAWLLDQKRLSDCAKARDGLGKDKQELTVRVKELEAQNVKLVKERDEAMLAQRAAILRGLAGTKAVIAKEQQVMQHSVDLKVIEKETRNEDTCKHLLGIVDADRL